MDGQSTNILNRAGSYTSMLLVELFLLINIVVHLCTVHMTESYHIITFIFSPPKVYQLRHLKHLLLNIIFFVFKMTPSPHHLDRAMNAPEKKKSFLAPVIQYKIGCNFAFYWGRGSFAPLTPLVIYQYSKPLIVYQYSNHLADAWEEQVLRGVRLLSQRSMNGYKT